MDLLYWLQLQRIPLGEKIFGVITYLGSDKIVIAVICALLWIFGRRAALRTAITFAGSGAVNQVIKTTFKIQRPWLRDMRLIPVQGALGGATGYSFPSGHSQTAASLFASVMLYFRKKWLYVLGTLCILGVMASRLYLGVHTPLDVVTGCLVSLCVTFLIDRLLQRAEQSPNYYRNIFIWGAAGSLGMVCFVLIKAALGTPFDMIGDILPAAGGALGFVSGMYMDSRRPEAKLPYTWGALMFALGILAVFSIKLIMEHALRFIPAAQWRDFICYSVLALYITSVHPSFMRVFQHRLSICSRS